MTPLFKTLHTGLFSVFIASLCRFTTSLNFLTLCYRSSSISARRTVSSANIRSCIVQLSKQTPPWNCALASRATMFRTILNNHGDRGHPCCTLYSTSKHSVSSSSNLTLGLILTSLVRGVFQRCIIVKKVTLTMCMYKCVHVRSIILSKTSSNQLLLIDFTMYCIFSSRQTC